MGKKTTICYNDLQLGIHKGRVHVRIPPALAAKGFPIVLFHNEAERLARDLALLAKVVTPESQAPGLLEAQQAMRSNTIS